ncbi:MAG TPA: hypothetical protein VFS39_09010 [Nitrospira sp.]|nr:hypothetical protein [Nitrospira sp.]
MALGENNYLVDMHLIHLGMTKNRIKLHRPGGDTVFPLTEQAQKTKEIRGGHSCHPGTE